MTSSVRRLAMGAALWSAAGCAAGAPGSEVAAARAPRAGDAAHTSPYGVTHHALLVGSVVDAAGAPLDSVEVVTWKLADPGRGSLPNHSGLSDRNGAVSVAVQLTTPAAAAGDTFTVGVIVRGYAFAARHRCGAEPVVDSSIVAVRMAPVADAAPTTRTRLVLPVRRC